MKRFWVILLALGLMAASSTTVLALDVKFSGEYYAAGLYLDKTTLNKNDVAGQSKDVSTAFYYQRLRVRTDFAVSQGLTLITRFDAMERAWGAARSNVPLVTPTAVDSAGTVAENENIAWDWAYINYRSPIGVFDAGYMNYGTTGTIFGNNTAAQGRIKYSYLISPVTINAAISKVREKSLTAINAVTTVDADNDVYHLEGVYAWKTGRAGLNINYYRSAENRPAPGNYKTTYFLYTPYALAKIGPVALQAELNYANGKTRQYDSDSGLDDIKLENWSGWIDATADLKMFYAGATVAYVSGDDLGTADKQEGGTINGGRDWDPCLIMFNYNDRAKWAGNLVGYNGSTDNGIMANAWFYQVRGGLKPIDKLDVMASASYAYADKKPANYVKGEYGWEVDVTATYKITNNLSYMLGVGYLFTGDYYKGASEANALRDDYLVLNKLTLVF